MSNKRLRNWKADRPKTKLPATSKRIEVIHPEDTG